MDNFEALEAINEEVVDETDAKKQEKKAAQDKKKTAFIERCKSDAEFLSSLGTLTDTVEVLNSLAHPLEKGLIKGKGSTAEKRVIETVPGIVGYILQNKGTEALEYDTEVFKKVDDKYVGEKVKKVAKPGEKFCLTKKYTTVLASNPQFGLSFANGTMRRGSKKANTPEEEFEAYYFKPSNDIKVNSDEFKKNIGVKGEGENDWGVLDEYLETFGYLCNEEEKTGRTGGRTKVSKQDVNAYFLHSLYTGSAQ